ncbi:MAG: flagellar hook assembly protein FlgD [Lachnospirales bacterium]
MTSTDYKSTFNNFVTNGDLSSKVNKDGSIGDKSKELDKNAFLNLLVTQLKYQDPTNPVEDKEFIAQMAQFTTLEEMQNMNATLSKAESFSMIGKYVVGEYVDSATGETVVKEGRVEGVTMSGNTALLTIGDTDMPAEAVKMVFEDYTDLGILNDIRDALLTSENTGLVGKTIQAIITNEDGEQVDYVEGVVDYIKFENGSVVLSVGNKNVYGNEIISISEENLLLGKEVNYVSGDTIVKGAVSDIVFKDDQAYAVVDGVEVAINKINHITEASGYVGEVVEYGDASYQIASFIIRDGNVYLIANNEDATEIPYADIRGKN